MRVEYIGAQRPKVTYAETRNSGCERLRNGLHATPQHCIYCEALLRQCKPRAYSAFDSEGRVIHDWHIR